MIGLFHITQYLTNLSLIVLLKQSTSLKVYPVQDLNLHLLSYNGALPKVLFIHTYANRVVPKTGVEPALYFVERDFKSLVSTNSTT